MSEQVGTIDCPSCGTEQPIKKNKRGALFIGCRNCGSDPRAAKPLQEFILKNGNFEAGKRPSAPVDPPKKKPADSKPGSPTPPDPEPHADDDDTGDVWNL